MANMVVSGLVNHWMGQFANYNGTYTEGGTENGKAIYTKAPNGYIHWTGNRWQISTNDGWGYELIAHSIWNATAPTPDLVEDWYGWDVHGEDDNTLLPNVTVTAEGGGGPEPPAKKYRYKPVSQLTGSIRQLGT